MSEQQFVLDKLYYSIMTPIEKISVGRNYITYGEVVDLLNEQQVIISSFNEENEQLKDKLDFQLSLAETKIKNREKENEQLRKIGVMYQGYNPCKTCTYSFENKVCCADPTPLLCDDAKKNFIQGLCKKHKQILKSNRRYDDE